MAIALVADAHIGGPGGPAGPLVQQLDGLTEDRCEQLVLMGDLFHVWIGDRRYETPEILAVVEALRRVRSRGIPVHYIEGNRDFFLEDSPYDDAFDAIHLQYSILVGDRRFRFVHGDGLNDRDWRYRFWRWLSKSAVSRFFVHRIPGALARRIVDSTERRLSTSNFKHKAEIPERAIRRFAGNVERGKGDVLVLGHFHEPRLFQLEADPGKVQEVWLLDAWFKHREMRWLGSAGEVSELPSMTVKERK